MTKPKDGGRDGTGKGNADARYEAWTTEGEPIVDVTTEGGRSRARDLGLWFGPGKPGKHNAITDVKGVRVGHCTIVHGHGPIVVGKGPARTGVTAILPVTSSPPSGAGPVDDSIFLQRLPAAGYVLNGAGELVGLTQVQEWGLLESPIVLTNTLAIGVAHQAVVEHLVREVPDIGRAHDTVIPLIGECDDSWVNDIAGAHVKPLHVHEALQRAASPAGAGPVAEGTVGSGTGMISFDFAAGIGTSSRLLKADEGGYTVGVLVQSNFGRIGDLRLSGVPLGLHLEKQFRHVQKRGGDYGSIIVVLATDAPLLPHQLHRVAKRAALGIGRTGTCAAHGSGEIILAFSTANRLPRTSAKRVQRMDVLSDEHIDPIFRAAIDATEEAIANALCMAGDVLGANHHLAPALPLDRVRDILSREAPRPRG
jgi:D-aminopeptidase